MITSIAGSMGNILPQQMNANQMQGRNMEGRHAAHVQADEAKENELHREVETEQNVSTDPHAGEQKLAEEAGEELFAGNDFEAAGGVEADPAAQLSGEENSAYILMEIPLDTSEARVSYSDELMEVENIETQSTGSIPGEAENPEMMEYAAMQMYEINQPATDEFFNPEQSASDSAIVEPEAIQELYELANELQEIASELEETLDGFFGHEEYGSGAVLNNLA